MPIQQVTDPTKFQQAVDRLVARIPSAANQDVVRRYVRERRVKGLRLGTILSDLNGLVAFCIAIGSKSLEGDVGRDDVLDYLTTATRRRIWRNRDRRGKETITEQSVALGAGTLQHRKIVIRAFFKWMRGTTQYPPEVADLGGGPRQSGSLVADRLITADDLKRLIDAQPDSRGKGILAILYETGFRAQEFCSLNLSSFRLDGNVGYLRLPKGAPGLKTGAREAFIIDSLPYLRAWLNDHPFGKDRDAPLFVSMSNRNPRARFTNGALYVFCIRAGRAAHLEMDTNPHLFRHSAATERARLGWNETQMRHYFGWTKDSDMPSRYVHFAGGDCERMELARRGLLTDDQRPQPALRPITCRQCKAPNIPTAAFCGSCALPISPEAAAEAKRRQIEALADEMQNMVRASVEEIMAAKTAAAGPT